MEKLHIYTRSLLVPKLVFSHKDVRLSVLRIPEFESQKFLKSIKIPVFSFLNFSYFELLIFFFLKYWAKNTSRTKYFSFDQKLVILYQMLIKYVSNWVVCPISAWYCQAQPKVQTKASAFGWDGYNIIIIQPPTHPPTRTSMKETR